MSSYQSKPRKCRVELLEKRTVLNGTVTVAVVDGVLTLTGDALSNGVSIAPYQTQGSDGTLTVVPNAFIVEGDATTSINQGQPNSQFLAEGVTGGMKLNLAGGDDALVLEGYVTPGRKDLIAIGPVSVQTGAGNDSVKISDFGMSRLEVAAGSGQDTLDVSDCVVNDAVTLQSQGQGDAAFDGVDIGLPSATGTPVSLISLSSTNFGLRLRRTHLGHSTIDTFDRAGGSVAISDGSSIGGNLTVTSRGSLDFSMDQTVCAENAYLKFEMKNSSARVTNSSLGGDLSIDGRGAAAVTLESLSLDNIYMKLENNDPQSRSRVAIGDLDGDGVEDLVFSGPIDFSATRVSAVDMHLKFDGIKGARVADTTHLNRLTISGGLFVTSNGVEQTSFVLDGTRSQDAQTRLVDLAFAGETNFSASNVDAVDMFLKLTGIKGERVADTTNLNRLTISGGLFVTSSVQDALSIDGIRGGRASIKMEMPDAQARSSVRIADMDLDGDLSIRSVGAVDVAIAGISADPSAGTAAVPAHAADVYMQLVALAGQAAASSLSIADLDLDGALDIISRGALAINVGGGTTPDGTAAAGGLTATDVFIKIGDVKGTPDSSNIVLSDMTLSGQLHVQTGKGDDLLTILDSSVGGPIYLNGGAGNDTLVIRNTTHAQEVIEISWETMDAKYGLV